jgi:KDO2-lipid IV(A) lauroyltransferase
MARRRGALRNRVEAAAASLALLLFGALPEGAAGGLGRTLGRAFRRLSRRRRELVSRNLEAAFPVMDPKQRDRLAVAVFEHFGALTAELLRMVGEPLDSVLSRVEIVGAEHARAAAESGRGVFFLTAHLGNWELGALVTATVIGPVTVIARPLDNPLLEERLQRFRRRTGNVVQPKVDAARPILRVLRSGGVIGILADQHARPPDAVVVPFFGRPASTTSSVARLADRTEALVLPVFAVRVSGPRYRLIFEPPLDVRLLRPGERTPEAITARVNQILEERIRAHPEQWLWMHDRWRLPEPASATDPPADSTGS